MNTDSKIHLAVDAHGIPVRFFITSGTTADCTIAARLIEGMIPAIPPRKSRKHPRKYDKYFYKLRHLVENAFLLLKRWLGIATRYAKNAASFAAAVQIRYIDIWLLLY